LPGQNVRRAAVEGNLTPASGFASFPIQMGMDTVYARRASFVGLILSLAMVCAQAAGSITTIALTGDDAWGVAGAKFGALQAGPLNNSGEIAFTAQLQEGVAGVGAGDDEGIWQFDGSTATLLAREGLGGVPGVEGGSFYAFHDVVIDTTGGVAIRAELAQEGSIDGGNNQGLWRFTGGVGSLVSRTGVGNVPGVTGASFGNLPRLRLGDDGLLVYDATLKLGGGVNTSNDAGLWRHDLVGGTLAARESITASPGVSGATFRTIRAPRVNDNRQFVFAASLNQLGSVTPSNDFGIWKFSDAGGELIARKGIGNVPGVSSTNFDELGDPTINAAGQVAFTSTLTNGGAINPSNDVGVWLYSGTSGTLLARTGSGGVPGLPGADFEEFQTLLLSDSGEVLVEFRLAAGTAGVTTENDLGLWTFQSGENHLVARTGSGGVPDVSGASFFDFGDLAFNAQGFTAVEATLATGGDVSTENDEGLWLLGHSGGGRLIAREGDQLAGRTIAALSFVGNSGGNDGRPSGLNALGQVAFQASFTNGDSGLFLYSWLAADFDGDGDVDDNDLEQWEFAMGTAASADANLDGDSDGEDFLTWQRQVGLGAPILASPATTLPEPATFVMLLVGFSAVVPRRSQPV
jgi:hypothetical protein